MSGNIIVLIKLVIDTFIFQIQLLKKLIIRLILIELLNIWDLKMFWGILNVLILLYWLTLAIAFLFLSWWMNWMIN